MDDDCEEIYTGSLLKRYSKRPAKLEDITLADWAAWYDFSGKPYVKPSNDLDMPLESCIEHHKNDDDLNDDKVNENQCGKTKKRNKARIIRSVWFNKDADLEKHYRELIMLYTAWYTTKFFLIISPRNKIFPNMNSNKHFSSITFNW